MQIENTLESKPTYLQHELPTKSQDTSPSLHSLLIQSLSSKDFATLKFIFSNRDPEIISSTVGLLDDTRWCKKFIKALIARLDNFPAETADILRWLDVFLKRQSSICRENPKIIEMLKYKGDFFNAKENMSTKLLKLKGKLSFILEQECKIVNPDKYCSLNFGVPRVLVNELEQLEANGDELNEYPEAQEKHTVKKRIMKSSNHKRLKQQEIENDSFDDMFDEQAFENAMQADDNDEELDMDLEDQDEEMLYGQDDNEEEKIDLENENAIEFESENEENNAFDDTQKPARSNYKKNDKVTKGFQADNYQKKSNGHQKAKNQNSRRK